MKMLTNYENTRSNKLINKLGFKIEKKAKQLGITMADTNCILFQNSYVKTWNPSKQNMLSENTTFISERNFCD